MGDRPLSWMGLYVIAFATASGLYAIAGTTLLRIGGDGGIFYEIALWTGIAAIASIAVALILELAGGLWTSWKTSRSAEDA